jgi:hypothetical protein
MTWNSSGASSMSSYLTTALGGPPALLPALLGLRLVTETRFGKLEPYSLHDRLATRASNTRQLEFAPAVPSAAAALDAATVSISSGSRFSKAAAAAGAEACDSVSSLVIPHLLLPPKAGACGLSDALIRLQELCCAGVAGKLAGDRSGLLMHTPATLAKLVIGLAGRVELQLGEQEAAAAAAAGVEGRDRSSSGGVMQLLQQLPHHWQLQPPFQLAWQAAWQWLLQAMPAAGKSSAADPQQGSGSSSSSSAGQTSEQQLKGCATPPLVYSGTMQPTGIQLTATPMLRLVLLTKSALAKLQHAGSSSSRLYEAQQLQQALPGTVVAAVAAAVGAFFAVDDALSSGKELGPGVAVIDSVAVAVDAKLPDARPVQVRQHM